MEEPYNTHGPRAAPDTFPTPMDAANFRVSETVAEKASTNASSPSMSDPVQE